MHDIFLSKEAAKMLASLEREKEEMIRNKIRKLGENPEFFGKHLKGVDLWSLRIGKCRVLFELNEEKKEILVITIGHRKDVYHKM
jgi:mRNA interferase RelE/StbE